MVVDGRTIKNSVLNKLLINSVFVFQPSASYVGPRPLGSIKVLIAVFDFLPVCVIKHSCTTLVSKIAGSLFTNIRVSH